MDIFDRLRRTVEAVSGHGELSNPFLAKVSRGPGLSIGRIGVTTIRVARSATTLGVYAGLW